MKSRFPLSALIISITLVVGSVHAASYIPYGQVAGIDQATVDSWGWTEIHRSAANSTTGEASILTAATGDFFMMGIWDASNQVYAILGAGETSVVTAITSTTSYSGPSALDNWSNGLNFYRTGPSAPSYGSWGFTNLDFVYQGAADIHLSNGFNYATETLNGVPTLATGLSMHNLGGSLHGGWSYNVTGNNQTYFSDSMERVFFTTAATSAVPEPSSMLGLGLLCASGVFMRRCGRAAVAA